MSDDYEDDNERELDGEQLTEQLRRDRLLKKFQRWDQALEEHWSGWQQDARRAMRYVAGHQWERDEKDKLEGQNKPTAVFNRIGPIIDAVVGAQINGRQEVKYFPREVGDSVMAETISYGADWLRDRGEAESEETAAFRDCFICGVGVIETLLDFEEDPEGKVVYNRLNPVSVLFDSASIKPNFSDARYVRREKVYSREEFEELYPGVPVDQTKGPMSMASYNSDPSQAYNNGDDEKRRSTDVSVRMYQWYEVETVVAFQVPLNPLTGQPIIDPETGMPMEPPTMEAEDFYELQDADPERFASLPPYEVVRRRKYRYAVVAAGRILEEGELNTKAFTVQAVTGKRDEEEGTWYGLVRPMEDPQKWANTFFNMMLHLMRTNAKGGVMIERGAVDDVRAFVESWAKSDAVNIVEDGAIQGGRIQQKPLPGIPAGMAQLLDQAVAAIQQVSGVNPEVLGLANREQPGVLEIERKRTVYGILAMFFDSFRRYRQQNGALLLEYMRQMPGQIVRVTQNTGVDQYVPLALDESVERYDIIVDEAPDGPHQKQQVFSMIQALLPMLMQADLDPETWAELLRYTPLPTALVNSIAQKLTEPDQQEQAMAQMAQFGEQLDLQAKQAKIEKDKADAIEKMAKAQATAVESANVQMRPDANPQVTL